MDGQLSCLRLKMVTLRWWKSCLQMGPNLINQIRYAACYDSHMSMYVYPANLDRPFLLFLDWLDSSHVCLPK